jgi:hypothetical protein
MILKEIPQTFEAVQFMGDNVEEVTKFCARHGAQVEFSTSDEGVTTGLLHTLGGSEKINRTNYVLASSTDQVTRIHKDYVENAAAARYEILPPEEEATNDEAAQTTSEEAGL